MCCNSLFLQQIEMFRRQTMRFLFTQAQIKAGLEYCCCCFVKRKLMNELEMIRSDDSREAVLSQVVF